MKPTSLPFHEYIENNHTGIEGYKIHYRPIAHIAQYPLGEKLFSQVCSNKVFTMIDCGPKEQSPYCHTSLLDLETGIDRPYESIPIRATACHLLDAQMPIVGYRKLFLLRERFNIIRCIKNIYEQPRMYTLEITQILEPFLTQENQTLSDDVHISTIDSCDSHLLAIASNGFITTWEKNGRKINDSSRKKGYCNQPFFSAGFNKKEKVICLGLNNGKIFVMYLMNLNDSKIIDLFPQAIKVNWMSVSENNFLFAGICKTKKEVWQEKHNYNTFEKCCKKNYFPPKACSDCVAKLYKTEQTISGTYPQLSSKLSKIYSTIMEKRDQYCEHTQKERNESSLPDICNACARESYHTVIPAAQLKEEAIQKNIIEYNKKNNQVIGEFHLIDDQEIIFAYKEKGTVRLKSLKLQQNIDFKGENSLITSLSSLVLLSRGNSYYSIISPGLISTNKPDTIYYINKSVRRIIGAAPYYLAPLLAPMQFIVSFLKTPRLSIPTAAGLLLFLYHQYSCTNI